MKQKSCTFTENEKTQQAFKKTPVVVTVFSWCALDGHQRSLCLFVEHMDGCLLLGSCAVLSIVISLLFQFPHLCLPRLSLSIYSPCVCSPVLFCCLCQRVLYYVCLPVFPPRGSF